MSADTDHKLGVLEVQRGKLRHAVRAQRTAGFGFVVGMIMGIGGILLATFCSMIGFPLSGEVAFGLICPGLVMVIVSAFAWVEFTHHVDLVRMDVLNADTAWSRAVEEEHS